MKQLPIYHDRARTKKKIGGVTVYRVTVNKPTEQDVHLYQWETRKEVEGDFRKWMQKGFPIWYADGTKHFLRKSEMFDRATRSPYWHPDVDKTLHEYISVLVFPDGTIKEEVLGTRYLKAD